MKFGALRRNRYGILSGPLMVKDAVSRLYDGSRVFCPVNEYDRAFSPELSTVSPALPRNNGIPRRLLPILKGCPSGEAAALLTLPLIRNPSAARRLSSSGLRLAKAPD